MSKLTKELISDNELTELRDFMEDDNIFVPVESSDPAVCPNCGLDLDDGEHFICGFNINDN